MNMRTLGVYLLYAAITLRGIVVFASSPHLPIVAASFLAYGLLLILEQRFLPHQASGVRLPTELGLSFKQKLMPLLYIAALSALVLGLMVVPETQDFFALLFIPLSMQAVLTFGRRAGFACIGLFSSFTIAMLLGSEDGMLFGLAMGVLFSGLLFLFGGYAYQVQQAETVRIQNEHMIDDLQAAHRQLESYTHQMAALSVEQERSRLARDLHDSVTQTAFSMNLASQSASLLIVKDPARAMEQLLRLEKLAASALSEIQTLVTRLRPRTTMEESLQAMLRKLAASRQEAEGLHLSLHFKGDKILTEAQATALYSIANEALTNVMKHSGVLDATLRLNLSSSGSYLEIEDEGAGFDPATAMNLPGHLGMPGMYEQAHNIGWTLNISSRQGQGTRIRVTEI